MKSKNKVAHKSHNILELFKADLNPYNHSFIASGSVSTVKPADIRTFFIDFNIDKLNYII